MKTRTILSWGGIAGFLLLLTGVALAQDQDNTGVWLPFSASSYADDIDKLYRLIFWVTTAMFLLTEGLLLTFCVIYRRRPGHRPTYTHGNNTAEIAWTIVPALMLLGLAVLQIPTWNNIKKDFPAANAADVTVIDFLGEQFKWNVRYPGAKEKYKGDNEYTNLSNVHIPFGNTALFNLRSKDVIHSIFIPHMRVKQDTVPGLRQKAWFKANRFFLVDLAKDKVHPDGKHYYALENNEWVEKPRLVQPHPFVYLDDAKNLPTDAATEFFLAKDFLPGGKLYDKKIAVQGQNEINGLYVVPVINGVPKKVRVLSRGQVSDGQFADCQYALGIFEIACAELCGMGHYTMRGFLYVEPPAAFEAWLKSEVEDASEPPVVWKYWRS
ncbi:MAG TPA: cytochrome c oxidase subunit II transmembrane domain-containing protein [Planctomycetota bacterium]|nr:cytochrome c oxidase subunit II transmembrane domain-containing protein [Planctomycetota bacterium]